jgi:SAM-dependent methyltransferase
MHAIERGGTEATSRKTSHRSFASCGLPPASIPVKLTSIRTRLHALGWFNVAKILLLHAEGALFDWRNGTDTFGRVSLKELEVPFQTKIRGTKYDPSPLSPLRKVFSEVGILPGDVFVDFGSGKGRALLVASQFCFRRIIGVEFSRELCAIARENVSRYAARHPRLPPIEVIEADASEVPIEPDASVLYFFNPFDAQVMRQVLSNVEQSFRAHPRLIRVMYYHPACRDVIEQGSFLRLQRTFHIMGREILLYHSKGPD